MGFALPVTFFATFFRPRFCAILLFSFCLAVLGKLFVAYSNVWVHSVELLVWVAQDGRKVRKRVKSEVCIRKQVENKFVDEKWPKTERSKRCCYKHRRDTKWSCEYDGHWKEIAFNVIKVGKKVDFIYLFILCSPILYLFFHAPSTTLCSVRFANARQVMLLLHCKCSVLNFKINRRLQAAPKNKWFVFSFFFMCVCWF